MKRKKTQLISFGLIIFLQLLSGLAGSAPAQTPSSSDRSPQSSSRKSSLVGSWQNSDTTLEISANGTLILNGKQYSYKASDSEIVISDGNKTVSFPFELSGDYLTITLTSQRVMFKRVASSGGGGGDNNRKSIDEQIFGGNSRQSNVSSEIVGRWKSDKGILEFGADGMMTINGEQVAYKVNGSAISVSSPEGPLNFPFKISGDQLTMGASGRQVVYTRIGGGGNSSRSNSAKLDGNDESEPRFDNKQPKGGGIIGRWQSDEATLDIRPNGIITINAEQYSYKVSGSTITVSSNEGSMDFPFQLSGDKMIVSVEGRRVVYTRITGYAGNGGAIGNETNNRGANPPELVGKWCYMSNLTGSNSRMSNRCFTLKEDGTYEYYAETSSSGSVASSASQEWDAGRWSASPTTITAYSNSRGKITYSLEKRNHPKTGDPMLIVDGDAYVTAYRKNPW